MGGTAGGTFSGGVIVALKIDEPRFTNEDAIKLGVRPPKGSGLHSLRDLSGQMIRRNPELQILRIEEDKRPPWAGSEGKGLEFLGQIAEDTIRVDPGLWAKILERCWRGDVCRVHITVVSEPINGKLIVERPRALSAQEFDNEPPAPDEEMDGEIIAQGQYAEGGRRVKTDTFDVRRAVGVLLTRVRKLSGETVLNI